MSSVDEDEEIDNGYPFRDDIINFYIKCNGKKHYFEFPILSDRAFLLREIKTRTKARGTFCLRFCEKGYIKDRNKNEKKKEEKSKEKQTNYEEKEAFYLHSSNITTLALKRFSGQTLSIVSGRGPYYGGDPTWEHYSQDPVLEYKRKLIQEKFKPFDCPP